MKWFADNSELMGIREAECPDILLFGGIAISFDQELKMIRTLENIKKDRFGTGRAPVKWNFKDLKPFYSKNNLKELYEKMLPESKAWREELFDSTKDVDYAIIISCVESHSIKKKTIRNVKDNLIRYSFSNGLMRYALHVKENKPSSAQIVLDWPDGGDPAPFDSEYAAAYNAGKTADKAVSYHSGTLASLDFIDSPLYARMPHSILLQFSDLVVGAVREMLECALEKKPSSFGLDICKMIKKRFRGYPNNIFGRGINVPSGNAKFSSKVSQFIIESF